MIGQRRFKYVIWSDKTSLIVENIMNHLGLPKDAEERHLQKLQEIRCTIPYLDSQYVPLLKYSCIQWDPVYPNPPGLGCVHNPDFWVSIIYTCICTISSYNGIQANNYFTIFVRIRPQLCKQ